MYRLLFLIALNIFVIQTKAQTVSDMFIDMPDSITPYMNDNQRKELIELKKMEPDSIAVTNSAFGKIKLTRLSDSILTLQLSDHNSLELGKLDENRYVFIKTYGAPLQESTCYIVDKKWKIVEVIDFSDIDFTQKSDSISEHEQRELIQLLEFPLISASIADTPEKLVLKLETPLTTTEEMKKFDAIKLQRSVKWTGKNFK